MRIFRLLACWALLGASPTAGSAQEALVLSGGGARGLAHVGLFEGLEELGHDPDIVVGTSIGALVGALYAAGYTPDEIRDRILAIDWNSVFTPTPVVLGPDRSVRYPMLNLDLDVDQLRVARGLIPQWRINRVLAALLFDANARARGDFDRLARRYRAVATDLKTGDVVVLAEGDLARAARASMAVPGVFAPVSWGDRLLIDGGIVNNLPTDVARAMGARSVIAVDVGRPPDEIHSLAPLAVLGRAFDLIQENTQRDPVPPDALVLPRIDPNFGGASFPADPRPLFALGLEAGRRDLRPAPPNASRGKRPLPAAPDSLHELVVEAPDRALEELARRVFTGVAPGPYDPAAVVTAMNRLYTTGLFEAVWPRVIEKADTGRAAPVLLLQLITPPQISLSAAAGYENDRGARAWVSLDRFSRVLQRPAVLTASASLTGLERWASLGARVYARNRRALAWSAGVHVSERSARVFSEDAVTHTGVLRAGGWAGIEFPHILRDRVGTAAMRAEWVDEEDGEAGFSVGPLLRFTSLNPDILVVGAPMLLEAEIRRGPVDYSRLALRGSRAVALRSLLLAGVADLRLTSPGAPDDVIPALGDEHSVPGLQWGEERGRTRTILGVDAAYPLLSTFARLRLRSGTVSERIDPWDGAEWISGAQLGMVWRNPVATVEWGFGVSSRGDRRFDFSVGRHF